MDMWDDKTLNEIIVDSITQINFKDTPVIPYDTLYRVNDDGSLREKFGYMHPPQLQNSLIASYYAKLGSMVGGYGVSVIRFESGGWGVFDLFHDSNPDWEWRSMDNKWHQHTQCTAEQALIELENQIKRWGLKQEVKDAALKNLSSVIRAFSGDRQHIGQFLKHPDRSVREYTIRFIGGETAP